MNKNLKRKLEIAVKTSKLLQFVPYIRMIALCDSVAAGTAREESDIDLFIIAKSQHIFTVRYLCVFLLTLFKLKCIPEQGECKDKVSLSFFLSNDFLNLDRISTTQDNKKRRAKWIESIIPLFNENHQYLDFVDKNSWAKEYKKNYYLHMSSKSNNMKTSYTRLIIKKITEFIFIFFIGLIIEFIFRSIQIKKLYLYKHHFYKKEKMIINDKIIKLHCDSGKCRGKLF